MVAADVLIEHGETAAAVKNTSEALEIAKRRAESDLQNLNGQIQHAFALNHYARALTAANQLDKAMKIHRQAQKIFTDNTKLTETNPGLLELAMDLTEGEADTLVKLSDYSGALNSYQKSLESANFLRRKTKEHAIAIINTARLSVKIGLAQSKIADNGNTGERQNLKNQAWQNLNQGIELYKIPAEQNLLPLRDIRFYNLAQKEIGLLVQS
jgi:tetratricopeptide (TPR) repeat protein